MLKSLYHRALVVTLPSVNVFSFSDLAVIRLIIQLWLSSIAYHIVLYCFPLYSIQGHFFSSSVSSGHQLQLDHWGELLALGTPGAAVFLYLHTAHYILANYYSSFVLQFLCCIIYYLNFPEVLVLFHSILLNWISSAKVALKCGK